MIILQQNVNNILIIFIRGHFADSLEVGKGSQNLQVLRVKVCKRICLRKIKIQFKKRLNYLLAVPEVTYHRSRWNGLKNAKKSTSSFIDLIRTVNPRSIKGCVKSRTF